MKILKKIQQIDVKSILSNKLRVDIDCWYFRCALQCLNYFTNQIYWSEYYKVF